jgi:hypothetical protein
VHHPHGRGRALVAVVSEDHLTPGTHELLFACIEPVPTTEPFFTFDAVALTITSQYEVTFEPRTLAPGQAAEVGADCGVPHSGYTELAMRAVPTGGGGVLELDATLYPDPVSTILIPADTVAGRYTVTARCDAYRRRATRYFAPFEIEVVAPDRSAGRKDNTATLHRLT